MEALKKVEDDIKSYEMMLSCCDNESSRKKCTNELESLQKKRYKMLRDNPGLLQPTFQSTNCYHQTPISYSSSSPSTYVTSYTNPPKYETKSSGGFLTYLNPFNYSSRSSDKKDREADMRFQRAMLELEREKRQRQERMMAEQAANDELIARTASSFQQRNIANLKKSEVEMKEQMIGEMEKERYRRLRNYEEVEELERRAFDEARRDEVERRIARENEERLNAEWREQVAQEHARQENLTSQMIWEQEESLKRQEAFNLQKHQQSKQETFDLKTRYSKEREDMRKDLRKIDEEVKKSQEECRRKYAEMSRQAEEQLEELMRLLKQVEWSRTIETNWSNRLRVLKSTDRRVYRAMSQLKMQLAMAKIKNLNPEFIRKEMDRLKTEVSEVKRVMEREVENLEKLYDFSGKQFVLDIANSLANISDVCMNLTIYLDSQQNVPKFDKPEASKFYDQMDSFEDDFALAYRGIPSITSLKSKYAAGFQNSQSSVEAITDDGHVVTIEEIE